MTVWWQAPDRSQPAALVARHYDDRVAVVELRGAQGE